MKSNDSISIITPKNLFTNCNNIICSTGYLTCRELLQLLFINNEFYSLIVFNEHNLLTYLFALNVPDY